MQKVSIVGASGYVGGELLRLLLFHPKVKINQVISREHIGKPIGLIHPNLKGKTKMVFSSLSELETCDLLFVALPNGKSMKLMDKFIHVGRKVIDCGADFRLKDGKLWQQWYKTPHTKTNLLNKFVYGLPEINRNKIKKATLIAGPGCEAIVSILCLWPLIKQSVIKPAAIIIDAKMGSSQAGSKSNQSSHHPERSGCIRSYLPTGHRHTAEIEQLLNLYGNRPKVLLSATAVEMVRGVLVTIHVFLKELLSEKTIWKIYREAFNQEPFIRIIKQSQGLYRFPEPKILQGTNYCDIGFEKDFHSNRLVVIGAIDNLVKGTAGNAIQCMNLMSGYPETLGLEFPGLHPI